MYIYFFYDKQAKQNILEVRVFTSNTNLLNTLDIKIKLYVCMIILVK